MELFYLEIPSSERKNEIIDYINEFAQYKSDINGAGGLDNVMLDCDVENLGSSKTIDALGGVLERTEIDPSDGVLTSVYWFNVNETIHKYEDTFKDNI